jgi:CRISPR-associated protein (TIGR02584 family)
MSAPHHFTRRILLAVTGLSPQVVTETIFALSQAGTEAFLPTEVHVITTATGAEHARLELLSASPGWFHRLMTDYRLPAIAFDPSHIHVLRDVSGLPLDDIRDPGDNVCAANQITELLRKLTDDPNSALHVSIAGGRKTMGFYLGYALSLYGREQDRLSHVLVSPPFEGHPQFFYPTPYECVIHSHGKPSRALDCRQAEVMLAEIPFVRLRDDLPSRLLRSAAGLNEIVQAANRAIAPPALVLDIVARRIVVDGQPIGVGHTELSILLWLFTRLERGDRDVDWAKSESALEFLETARGVMGQFAGEYDRCERAVRERLDDPKWLRGYFEPHKTRINKLITDALGRKAASRYVITRSGPRGRSRYGLPLAVGQVAVVR